MPTLGGGYNCGYNQDTTSIRRPFDCRSMLNGSRTASNRLKSLRKQEAQLMLTNLRDAFGGQSRSSNIVPFHMLGIVSYCAIVTLSLRQYSIFDFKICRDLEMGVKGHSRSLRVVSFDRLCMVSYQCSLASLSLKCTVFEIFDFYSDYSDTVTLKPVLGVTQGHR